MAANATVQVNVISTADLAALGRTKAELADLMEQGRLTAAEFRTLGAAYGDITTKGGFDKALNDLRGITAETKNTAAAAAQVTQEVNKTNAGFNIGRFQAAALSRELANGSFNARTLGVSLASAGNIVSVTAIAAFTLFEVVNKIYEVYLKLDQEAAKTNTEFERSIVHLSRMAEEARSIGDQVKIGEAVATSVQKASDALQKFRTEQLNLLTKFIDEVAKAGQFAFTGKPVDEGPYAAARQQEAKKLQDDLNRSILDGSILLLEAARHTEEFAAAMDKVNQGLGQPVIDQYKAKVVAATADVEKWRQLLEKDPSNEGIQKAYQDALEKVEQAKSDVEQLTRIQDQYTNAVQKSSAAWQTLVAEMEQGRLKEAKALEAKADIIKKIEDEAAVANAAGNDNLTIQNKVKLAYDTQLATLVKMRDEHGKRQFTDQEAIKLAQIHAQGIEHQLYVTQSLEGAQRTYNVALHDSQEILQAIRLAQTVIKDQPFAGADQKQAQLMQAYRVELGLVSAAMAKLKSDIRGGGLDPNVLEQDKAKLQQLVAQYIQLQQKIGSGGHQLQAELQGWANSFGSTMHQVANTIEQTVGVALQSLNTYLTTGKFNAQQLLQSIIQLGLQLVEQLIIQQVVARINATLNATLAAAAGKAIALAYGPAATAATIATHGAAAAEAPFAVSGALASIMAILGGGSTLHEGGSIRRRRMHSGGLAHDEVPIIAQEGEIMIQRSVAQQPGMADYLLGLNAGMFHTGGFIAGQRYHRGSTEAWGGDIGGRTDLESLLPWESWSDVYTPHELGVSRFLSTLMNEGFSGPIGTSGFLQGPTMIPTSFDPMGYPFAVPVVTGDVNYLSGSRHVPERRPQHSGGLISRMHSGGSVGGKGGGGVHIYAFTDLKALTKHMGSKEGQKIIFDTVKGRRIDLGIT